MSDSHTHTELRKRVMGALREKKIPMPKTPEGAMEGAHFPDDLTACDTVAIRQMMSRFTQRLGFVNTLLSRSEIDAEQYKHRMKARERQIKMESEEERQWKVEATFENDPIWVPAKEQYDAAYGMIRVLKSLQVTYDQYFRALSRELSAREAELDIYNRSGG